MIGSFATFDVTGFDLHLSSKLVTILKKILCYTVRASHEEKT